MRTLLDQTFWNELDKDLPGWMSQEEARFLLKETRGKIYVEIGVAFGKSMNIMRNHCPDLIISGIDLIDHGVQKKIGNISFHVGDSKKLIPELYDDGSIDTLFIDGDHTYEGCLRDILVSWNKVRKDGRIIFHDYGRPTMEHVGVTKAVDAVRPLLSGFKEADYIAAGTKK